MSRHCASCGGTGERIDEALYAELRKDGFSKMAARYVSECPTCVGTGLGVPPRWVMVLTCAAVGAALLGVALWLFS